MAVETVILDGDDGFFHRVRDIPDGNIVLPGAVDTGIDGASDEEKAARTVLPGHGVRSPCLLDGRNLLFEPGQEVTDVLPGARMQHPDAPGEKESDEEEKEKRKEESAEPDA